MRQEIVKKLLELNSYWYWSQPITSIEQNEIPGAVLIQLLIILVPRSQFIPPKSYWSQPVATLARRGMGTRYIIFLKWLIRLIPQRQLIPPKSYWSQPVATLARRGMRTRSIVLFRFIITLIIMQ